MLPTILRRVSNTLIWLLVIVGVGSGLVWSATAAHLIKPLVVISGSMEPTYKAGDLLIARPIPAEEIAVGDIASIYTPVLDRIVTHRVVDVATSPAGEIEVWMKGDANEAQDGGAYLPGESVWVPRVRIPGAGRVVIALSNRSVVIPLLIALAAVMAMTLLPRSENSREEPSDGAEPDASEVET